MLCARCKVAIAYAPFDGNLPSYLVAVYRVGEASAVRVFVSPRKSCSSTMEAGVVAVAPPVTHVPPAAHTRLPQAALGNKSLISTDGLAGGVPGAAEAQVE